MAMQVTGGGSGSGTSSISPASYDNTTLFTTPNVANTMYIVSITWAPYASVAVGVYCLTPGAYGVVGATSPTAPNVGGGPNMMKIGPNTPVIVSFGSSITATATVTVAWSYNYVAILMS